MPAVAIVISSLSHINFDEVHTLFQCCLKYLTDTESMLDIIILDPFDSSMYLDFALGKLYSTSREVLLKEDRFETPVNVLFNNVREYYKSFSWDVVYIPKNYNASDFPHSQLESYEITNKTSVENTRSSTRDKEMYNVSALGGTFDHIHDGHKILLSIAAFLTSQRLIVGVTDQELLQNKKYKEQLQSFNLRCANVRDFLLRIKPQLKVEIVAIRDVCGPTGTVPEIESLIVSRETVSGGAFVNETRKMKGLKELEVHVVNVLGGKIEDGWKEKMSSTELRKRVMKKNTQQESL